MMVTPVANCAIASRKRRSGWADGGRGMDIGDRRRGEGAPRGARVGAGDGRGSGRALSKQSRRRRAVGRTCDAVQNCRFRVPGTVLAHRSATMKQPLQKLIASRYGGRNLPVALVLPDGGRVAAVPDARDQDLRPHLERPAGARLARARQRSRAPTSTTTSTSPAARAASSASPRRWSAPSRTAAIARTRAGKHWWHQRRAATGPTSSITTTSPTRSTGCGSTSAWSTRARTSRRRATRSTQAQAQKLDHICRKLRLEPGERFLDIGCGWGGLIFWAAQHYGVKASGITLSQNQFDHVRAKIAERGPDRTASTCELLDYLDLPEDAQYDKIASVGMFEHVGVADYPRYFGKIYRRPQAGRPGAEPRHHAEPRSASTAWAAASANSSRSTCFPGGQLAHVSRVIEGLAARGARADRRRGAARALREHAVALGRPARSERRRGAARGRRGEIPRLADLPGRARRTRSTAAGSRCGSCWPASRSPTAACRTR